MSTDRQDIYKPTRFVQYTLPFDDDSASALESMVEADAAFRLKLYNGRRLMKPFGLRILVYYYARDAEDPFTWNEPRCKIRRALVNRGRFALAQKERLKRNMPFLGSLTQAEKKHVRSEVDKELWHAWYQVQMYEAHCDVLAGLTDDISVSYYETVSITRSVAIVEEESDDEAE